MNFLKRIEESFNKDIFWEIYFVILVFIYISSYIFNLLQGVIDSLNLVNFTFYILIMLAFFCVIWGKKIFKQAFWKIIFILSITWKISLIAIEAKSKLEQLGRGAFIILYIKVFIFLFPLYLALYFYAFKSDKIWENDKSKKIILK
ncbi:MAG: hypothetical protein V1651_01210 [Patescibacteria group bacterium]